MMLIKLSGSRIACPEEAAHALMEALSRAMAAGAFVVNLTYNTAEGKYDLKRYSEPMDIDPRMPSGLQMFVQRVHRDDALITEIEAEVEKFLAEVEEKLEALRKVAA